MRATETDDAVIIETGPDRPCMVCQAGPGDKCRGIPHERRAAVAVGNPGYQAPSRKPASNMQRFQPGGRGPCGFCGEAAILDKVTGLCCPCARVYLLGRP